MFVQKIHAFNIDEIDGRFYCLQMYIEITLNAKKSFKFIADALWTWFVECLLRG